MKDQTIEVHGGYVTEATTRAAVPPIYQTVVYEFDDAKYAADLFSLAKPGNIYGRLSNPTTDLLERRLALLEGGAAAVATASGQAAVEYALMNLARHGQNIVSVPQVYGGTLTLFTATFAERGVEGRFARSDAPEDIEAAIDENTRAVYCETIGNPAGNIVDIAALAGVAHRHGIPLVVDNTVASPAICKPIEFGADVVVHSLTKFICGHGHAMGGAIVDGGRFDWKAHAAKFPQFNTPDESYHGVVYADAFGPAALAARVRVVSLRNCGAILPPMSAFLILMGLETLTLRVRQHVRNTELIAAYLKDHPKVAWVHSVQFEDNPYRALALKYTKGTQSGMLTFGLKGGREAGAKFHDAVKIFKRVVTIGYTSSCVTHPASTTHSQLSPEQLKSAGIGEELIRLTVGIEDPEDLIEDIRQALEQV